MVALLQLPARPNPRRQSRPLTLRRGLRVHQIPVLLPPSPHDATAAAVRDRVPRHDHEIREQEGGLQAELPPVAQRPQESSRFHTGMETTYQMLQYGNVWLVGHSLGSSMALAVGREMAKCYGVHLETYLFNPPFITLPIEWIKSKKVKLGLRIISSAITAGVAAIAGAGAGAGEMDPFTALSAWVPYLFINRSDPICSEYAAYFKHRGDMEAIGAGEIERVATENALGSIFSSCEALHFFPRLI